MQIERPTVNNPQKSRIDETMRTLSAVRPAVRSQRTSLSNLESYIKKFNQSDILTLEDEYARAKYQLMTKKQIIISIT